MAILQAPDGLQNPRETKAFANGNRAGKWSIIAVQIGNNFAHTLRDGSQHLLFQFLFIKQILDEHPPTVAASQSDLDRSETANQF